MLYALTAELSLKQLQASALSYPEWSDCKLIWHKILVIEKLTTFLKSAQLEHGTRSHLKNVGLIGLEN